MGRVAIVKGGEVHRTAGELWRASCCACDMGALLESEAEAMEALEDHLREYHNLVGVNG